MKKLISFLLIFNIYLMTLAQIQQKIAAYTVLVPKEGQEEFIFSAAQKLQKEVLKENGVLDFQLSKKQDQPNTLIFYEVFEDKTALEHHKKQKHTQNFTTSIEGKFSENSVTFLDLQDNQKSGNRGIEHIGITVPNVDTASDFFEKAIGAVVLYDVLPKGFEPFQGAETEKQLGIPKGSKIVHMRMIRLENGANIELFEFENSAQQKPAALNDYGITHLALYTDNIKTSVENFKKAGGEMLSEVHGLANAEEAPKNKGVYGKTPWGTLVEFITYPDGIQYPAAAPEKRWKPY